MLIKSSSIVEKDFPAEVLESCKKSRNFISRKTTQSNANKGLLQPLEPTPTLFEVENPVSGTIYDTFDIRSFTLDITTDQVLLNSYVSLMNPAIEITMSADIIQLDTQKVLAVLPSRINQNNSYLELNNDFQLDPSLDANGIATIVYANWTKSDGTREELSMLCDLNLMDRRLQYEHHRPSITDKGVVIGTPLDLKYNPGELSGTSDHIVLALYRMPADMKDVNYVCGFGNEYGKPYIGIPARGTFTMPNDYVPCMSGSYAPSATCIIGPRKGGGKQVANVIPEYYSNPFSMQFSANGSQLFYDMACSWDQTYKQPAEWIKSEFDYELKLTFYFQKGSEIPVRYNVHISSVESDKSAIKTIPPLYIMYGCLAADTLVEMADGSTRMICEIQIGDQVKGINSQSCVVRNTWRGMEEILICIQTEKGVLRLSETHPVLTKEGIKKACEVKESDELITGDGEYMLVLQTWSEEYRGEVNNLDLDCCGEDNASEHLFVAGGVMVGDNVLQNHMEELIWVR